MVRLLLIWLVLRLETLLTVLKKLQPRHPDDTELTPTQCYLLDAMWALDDLPHETPYKDEIMAISTILHAASTQLNTVRWRIVHERRADASHRK